MKKLKGFQKKHLRGLAHGLKAAVFIGQKGITDTVVKSIEAAINCHELIKVKFIEFKEKEQKKDMADAIAEKTNCEIVGIIGHTAIFYRQHSDPEKRKITVPQREA